VKLVAKVRSAREVAIRFLVIGSGAIGGSAGAYLARAGHEVLFVDTDVDHVRAMRAEGLKLEGRQEFNIPVNEVTPDEMR
jgi:2-dehydropantoate 2-reductase